MVVRRLPALLLCAVAAFAPLDAHANGLSGSYLAARHAGFESDYETAARYYTRALMRDASNPALMENAVTAYVSLGDFARAVPVAARLQGLSGASQVANFVGLAEAARADAYGDILADLDDGRSIGPLVDGLARAWALVGQGDMSDALTAFDAMSEQEGLQSFGTYHKALALALVGDYEGAAEIFDGSGAGPMLRTRRGTIARVQILSQLERSEDALILIDTIFGSDLDPELQQVRARLSAGAPVEFTTVSSARDGLAEIFYNVAEVLAGEASEAYTLLYARVAEHLRPDHIDALLLSAGLLEQLERFELATETYNRVPRDHPAFHAAELGRAEALRKAGRTDASLEVLNQLAESHGNLPAVHIATGHILRQLERYDDASRAYDRAIALYESPETSQWFVYYARGISHEREDRWEQAEADFRFALELNAGQPQVLNYLGYSLVEKNIKLDEALELIEAAVAAEPNSGYIVDSLGWVLYRLGRYEEAVVHMERAAELMPVDPIVNDHLGDVFWAVGRKIEAEFQWHRALSFDPEEKDAKRIRRKLEVGLDAVLLEEGAKPLAVARDEG